MKIGLVLSGGGARSIAQLGVLQAIEEYGLKPDIISGVSAGAIVGALYASGYAPHEILTTLVKARISRFFIPRIGRKGFLKMEKTNLIFRKYLQGTFEDLKIPLIVAATDFQNCRTTYFSEGELIKPLQASSCIPVIFDPVQINGKMYVDGGLLNNLPVEPLLGHSDFVIGVHSNPLNTQKNIKGMRSVLEHTFHLAITHNVSDRKKHCDVLIEPSSLKNFTIFGISKARDLYTIGYRAAQAPLKEFVTKFKVGNYQEHM